MGNTNQLDCTAPSRAVASYHEGGDYLNIECTCYIRCCEWRGKRKGMTLAIGFGKVISILGSKQVEWALALTTSPQFRD